MNSCDEIFLTRMKFSKKHLNVSYYVMTTTLCSTVYKLSTKLMERNLTLAFLRGRKHRFPLNKARLMVSGTACSWQLSAPLSVVMLMALNDYYNIIAINDNLQYTAAIISWCTIIVTSRSIIYYKINQNYIGTYFPGSRSSSRGGKGYNCIATYFNGIVTNSI